MAKEKKPGTRLRLIYDYVTDENFYEVKNIRNIMKHLADNGLDVAKKTVNNDLDNLLEQGLLERHEKGRATHYTSKNAFRPLVDFKNELDADDFFSLEMASSSLQQLDFVDLSRDLNRIIATLKKKRKEEEKRQLIQFDQRNLKMNKDIFRNLFEAVKLKMAIKIQYKTFKEKARVTEHVIHPYFLKEFNGRWFVIAWSEVHKNYSVFGIERIIKMQPAYDIDYNNSKYISPHKYSSQLFGLSRTGKAVNVVLAFTTQRAPYFESKPFLPIKKKRNWKGKVQFTFSAIVNNELQAQILYYGKDVEVIKPKKLRDDIESILNETTKNYS